MILTLKIRDCVLECEGPIEFVDWATAQFYAQVKKRLGITPDSTEDELKLSSW